MTEHVDEARRSKERLHRNQITTASIVAVLTSFVVAAYLGAFAKSELNEIPAWVSALTTVVATLISAYAVYLVGQTLKATRETLEATRQMAYDQKNLGDNQIRPWVLLNSFPGIVAGNNFGVKLTFKNFGSTPAKDLKLSAVAFGDDDLRLYVKSKDIYVFGEAKKVYRYDYRYLAPGQDGLLSVWPHIVTDTERVVLWIAVEWSYTVISSGALVVERTVLRLTHSSDNGVQPLVVEAGIYPE